MFSVPEKAEDFDHPGWWDFCKKVLKCSAQTDIGKSILGLLVESNVQMGCVLDPNSVHPYSDQQFECQTFWFIDIEKNKKWFFSTPIEDEDLLVLCVAARLPHELTHWGQQQDPHFIIKTDTEKNYLSSRIKDGEAEAEYTRALDLMERQRKNLPSVTNDCMEVAIDTYNSILVKNARSLPLVQLSHLASLSHSEAYAAFREYMWQKNKDASGWAKAYTEQFKAQNGLVNTAKKPLSAEGNTARNTLVPITWLLEALLRENPALLTLSPVIEPLTEEQMLLCRDVLVRMEGIKDSTWFTKEIKKDRELEIAQIMAGEMVYDTKLLNNALIFMNWSVAEQLQDKGAFNKQEKNDLIGEIADIETPEELLTMLTANQQMLCAVTSTASLITER